jgi:Fe-Mn family superoxide dismutase
MAAKHELPVLPYKDNELAPHISSQTIGVHYGKHHKAYVDKTNAAIEGSELADLSLEELIKKVAGQADKAGLFNNAAQVWNHSFYWTSMRPGGGGQPGGELKQKIEQAFGGYDQFREKFAAAAAGQFGSGWAWLVNNQGKLEIMATGNADTPLIKGVTPLITIDVWEHAYYLDYQNRRPDYINTYLDHLVNWDFAAENLSK